MLDCSLVSDKLVICLPVLGLLGSLTAQIPLSVQIFGFFVSLCFMFNPCFIHLYREQHYRINLPSCLSLG